jgi:hypothetical protein
MQEQGLPYNPCKDTGFYLWRLKTKFHLKIHGIPVCILSEQGVATTPEDIHTPGKNQVVPHLKFNPGADLPVIIIGTPLAENFRFNPFMHEISRNFEAQNGLKLINGIEGWS